MSILNEEVDVLWWLLGGYSNDLKQPFESMNGAVAAIIGGKELADHVVHLPGPISVRNILHRVIQKSEGNGAALPLGSAVTKLPMSWRRELVAEGADRALRYCPLLAAISHCVRLEDNPSWVTPFANHFPHSPNLEILPEVLAYQMYRERMLLLNLG